MTIVVSDTSPLNLLIRIGQSDLLPHLFGHVVIPTEVADEMHHAKAAEAVRTFIAQPPPWLSIQAPSTMLTLPELDRGETAAISLAVELNAMLLIDERDGRNEAQSRGLTVIGAIGVLERAADFGYVADLAAIHDEIRLSRFHVAEAILRDSLTRHLETRRPPLS